MWILIALIITSNGGVALTTTEFSSFDNCAAAKAQIELNRSSLISTTGRTLVCVAK